MTHKTPAQRLPLRTKAPCQTKQTTATSPTLHDVDTTPLKKRKAKSSSETTSNKPQTPPPQSNPNKLEADDDSDVDLPPPTVAILTRTSSSSNISPVKTTDSQSSDRPENTNKKRKGAKKTRQEDKSDCNTQFEETIEERSVKVPGELVMAIHDKPGEYWPARVLEKLGKRFRVEYCTGHKRTLARSKFYTQCDYEYQTCKLGNWDTDVLQNEETRDEGYFRKEIESFQSELQKILDGKDPTCWRYRLHEKGTHERRSLLGKMGQGPFSDKEFHMIHDIVTEKFGTKKKSRQRKGARIEEDSHLCADDLWKQKICFSVLVPECIVRLIMRQEGCSREAAEEKMLQEDSDDNWVEDILAARSALKLGTLVRQQKGGREEEMDL